MTAQTLASDAGRATDAGRIPADDPQRIDLHRQPPLTDDQREYIADDERFKRSQDQ